LIVSKPEYHDLAAAATWIKSGRSGPYSDNCVELADLGDGVVAMRDSTHPEGPVLAFTPGEIRAFIEGCKDGEFDYLIA
jgi:hypothetical protein